MADSAEVEFELAIVSEPEGTELSDIEGVDDELALHVVALTLARAAVAQSVEVSLLVTGDEHIRELNRDFRGKDEATDVLSFPLLDEPLVDAPEDELWQAEDETPVALNGASMPSEPAMAEPGTADDDDEDDEDEVDDDDEDDDEIDDDDELDDEDDTLGLEDSPLHLGDVAISRETLARQAQQAGHSLAWEFAYLLAHGVLHLVGYDDRTEAGYRAMVAHQTAVLAELGISH